MVSHTNSFSRRYFGVYKNVGLSSNSYPRFKKKIIFSGKERPAKTKLMSAKFGAELANLDF